MIPSLRKYSALFLLSFKDRLSSPPEVLARAGFFAVVIWVFSRLWAELSRLGVGFGGTVGPRDLVWYLFVAETIVLSLPPLTEQVDQDLQTGAIAYQLVRPLDYVSTRAMSFLGEVFARFAVNAVVGGVVALLLVGTPTHLWPLLQGFPLVLGAFAIHLGISLSIGMLGFWVQDTLPFFWIYSKAAFILGGLLMPIDYYPSWLQSLCRILPLQDGVYSVAQVALGLKIIPVGALLLRQTLWAGGFVLLALFLHHRGVRRLEVQGG